MKKGFTLVELLAVIVILAVIALIATPMILNLIENVRYQSFTKSMIGYEKQAEIAIAMDSSITSFETGDLKIKGTQTKYLIKYEESEIRFYSFESLNGEYQIDVTKCNSKTYCLLEEILKNKNVIKEANPPEKSTLVIKNNTDHLNTIATLQEITDQTILIDQVKAGEVDGVLKVDDEIILQVTSGTEISQMGKYEIYKIKSVSGNTLTLDRAVSTDFNISSTQVVKIVKADIINIESGVTLRAPLFDGKTGGIIALEASEELILSGTIDANYTGYTYGHTSPLNGGKQTSGNASYSGGSNQFSGGQGGVNYQNNYGHVTNGTNAVDMTKYLYMGGGSNESRGGGIVYLKTNQLIIKKEQSIRANGEGGKGVTSAGAAGGSIYIKANNIIGTVNLDYFAGATGGGGGCEKYINSTFPSFSGENGTNLKGGNGCNSTSVSGGLGVGANGGGGAKEGSAGTSATLTSGGMGGHGTTGNGWNAGSGGGGGGHIGIYTNNPAGLDEIKTYPQINMYSSSFTSIYKDINNSNTSATIANIDGSNLTLQDKVIGELNGDFQVNDEVLLIATKTANRTLVGTYELSQIKKIEGSNIRLNHSIDSNKFSSATTQIVKVAQYNNLVIYGTIKPSTYDGSKGGIVAIKVDKLLLYGSIDASFKGYTYSHITPLNGQNQTSGNSSYSGGSNQFSGGRGGTNYQNITTPATAGLGDINLKEQITFGGGSNQSRGGGIIYLDTKQLSINHEYAISSNGEGGKGVTSAGAAGGSVLIKTDLIKGKANLNYFAGATAGGGGCEHYVSSTYPSYPGANGTNLKAGNGCASNSGNAGGTSISSNGGGGAKYGANGGNATITTGGVGGSGTVGNGWNSGSSGGGGGYIGIISNNSDIVKGITVYPSPKLLSE